KTWTDEGIVAMMIAKDVADILTEKAFDAFTKFLHSVDVLLQHTPTAIRRVGWARFELLDLFLDPKVPRNVGHQIFDQWKGLQRLHGDRLVERNAVQPCHAHQLGLAVDLCRA